MVEHNIDIAMISETITRSNQKEKRKTFTWYSSGENVLDKNYRFSTGVAIVISNKLEGIIDDIDPVNDRIMSLKLRYKVPITIFSIYAPPSERTTQEKETFYELLTPLFKKASARGPAILGGDFNARVQTKLDDSEQGIGPFTFDKEKTMLEAQGEEIQENRQLLYRLFK